MNIEIMDSVARRLLQVAGEKIIKSFKTELTVETKANWNDLVTNMDKSTEEFFVCKLKEYFPDHKILGEEGMAEPVDSMDGYVWILDPIDGTTNFVKKHRDFAISLALYVDGEGILGYVYDVERQELYYGRKGHGATFNGQPMEKLNPELTLADSFINLDYQEIKHFPKIGNALDASRGQRFFGAEALELISVAAGRAGGHINVGASSWDFAAGKIIAEELGAVVTRTDGSPINMLDKGKGTILAGYPKVHKELMDKYLN